MEFILRSFNNTANLGIDTLIKFIPRCTHSNAQKIPFSKVVNETKEYKSKKIKQRSVIREM